MLNYRANILFDDQEYKQLVSLAKMQNTSVGNLVRTAVKKTYYDDAIKSQRAQAIDETIRIRPNLKGKINYKALINDGRKY